MRTSSCPPLAIIAYRGLKATTRLGLPACPSNVCTGPNVVFGPGDGLKCAAGSESGGLTSHTCSFPSSDPEMTNRPSGVHATSSPEPPARGPYPSTGAPSRSNPVWPLKKSVSLADHFGRKISSHLRADTRWHQRRRQGHSA